jgi:DNA-binding SARP family transcriptional activator
MALISVRTLGTVAIEVGARRLGPSAGRPFAVLLYLTSRRGQPTPRSVLQELLLGGTDESKGGHNLRQLFYRLRQLGVPLKPDTNGVKIEAEHVWMDWWAILERGELGTADLELIAQGLFPGYSPESAEGYREWFEAERSMVRLRLSRAVGLQLTQLRRIGQWDLVEVAARALLALDPLSEEGMLARAQALAASGSKVAALRLIDAYLREIGDEQPNLRLMPAALRRRISERLPELGRRAQDDRIFVGREDAMRMLSATGSAARAGTQQTVLVWGEPGIGKTRLLAEYKTLACLQGALAFQTTCQPHDAFRPLGILSDLIAQLLEAPGALGCDPEGRELLEKIATSLRRQSSQQSLGETTLSLIVRSLNDLLAAISSESPLLVLIDDAQWLDSISLKVLLTAWSSKEPRRSSIVFASNTRALLANDGGFVNNIASVRLNPLAPPAARELARSLLAQGALVDMDYREQQVLLQAGGNPLFIKLLSLDYASTGDATVLRHTIADILGRRLEQLSSDAMRALEGCVVLGKNCTYARLENLLGITRLKLLLAIEELDDRGLIEIGNGCFVSGHALLAKAVCKRISTPVQQALHATAAAILARELAPGQGGPLPWDCAEHWRLAGNPTQAVAVLRLCAQRALDITRPDDALAILKHALNFDVAEEVRLQLVEAALELVARTIDRRGTQDLINERNQLRLRLKHPAILHDKFEIMEIAAHYHSDRDPRDNIARLQACVTASGASPVHRVEATRQLLMTAELTIDHKLADFAFAITKSDCVGSLGRQVTDLLYHTCFGSVDRAKALASALAHVDLENCPEQLLILLNLGYVQYRIASPAEAEATLQRALEMAQRSGIASGEMHASLLMARLYWSTSRRTDSRSWLEHAEAVFLRSSDPSVLLDSCIVGLRLATAERRLADAEHYLTKARGCTQASLALPRLTIACCEAELRILRGEAPCSEDELKNCLSLHRRARGIGCQDEIALAMLKCLMWFGLRVESQTLLKEYLQFFRRDGFEPGRELESWADELELNGDCRAPSSRAHARHAEFSAYHLGKKDFKQSLEFPDSHGEV